MATATMSWNRHIPQLIVGGVIIILIALFVVRHIELTNAQSCKNAPQVRVCGADNVQYSSVCDMTKAKTSLDHYGSCDGSSVMCAPIYDPVCGKDGITYENACVATRMNSVAIEKKGVC